MASEDKYSRLLEKAGVTEKESKAIDFKEAIDFESARDCCELIKDIVSMANSGGGVIVIGAKDDGGPSGFDPALVLDKLRRSRRMTHLCSGKVTNIENTIWRGPRTVGD